MSGTCPICNRPDCAGLCHATYVAIERRIHAALREGGGT